MPNSKKQKVNFKDFIVTPYGKGVTAINNRALRQELETRYRGLDKYGKSVKVDKVYKHNDSYYIHIHVPSESERQNFYDVVIKFIPNSVTKSTKPRFIFNYDMELFSNCPSFTYTFAHVYKKFGIICNELVDKYEDEVFKNKPETKNPYFVINYDKSIYFALHFLDKNMSYLTVANLEYLSRNNSLKTLIKNVRTTKEIKKDYEDAVIELRKQKEEKENKRKNIKKEIDKKISITNKRESSSHVIKPKKANTATKAKKPRTARKK